MFLYNILFWYLLCVRSNDRYVLELDFEPFNASFPRPNRSSSIGNGVQFLNRHLSSIMFRNKDSLEPLLDFLRAHKYKGHVSLLSNGPSPKLFLICSNVTVLYYNFYNYVLYCWKWLKLLIYYCFFLFGLAIGLLLNITSLHAIFLILFGIIMLWERIFWKFLV